jgi:hypothetical protein
MAYTDETALQLPSALAPLARLGYGVQPLALEAGVARLPSRSRIALCFAHVNAVDGQAMIAADAAFVLRGDRPDGLAQCWKISRSFRPRGSCPWIVFGLVLTVYGDVASAFSGREGRACHDMLRASLSDAASSIADLPVSIAPCRSATPTAVIDIYAVGDVVTCRSGVVRHKGVALAVSIEQHSALLMSCDRLSRDILPDFESSCWQAVDAVTSPERGLPTRETVEVGNRRAQPSAPSRSVVSTPLSDIQSVRDASSILLSPQRRGRYVQ